MFLTPSMQVNARTIRSILNTVEKMEAIPLNVEYNSKEYVYKAVLPGFNRDEIKVSIENGNLKIVAEKKEVQNVEGVEENVKVSSAWSIIPQSLTISMPRMVDLERITVSLENGILTVNLPKQVPDVKLLEIK